MHPALEKIADRPYSEIIDIGCAEGYYAVGLARMFSQTLVFAFDIDKRAQSMCLEMASLNGVEDRVKVSGACSQRRLIEFPFTGRGLIVCDCESYEKDLFDRTVAAKLNCCDVIIEVHDYIDRTISAKLKNEFEQTHNLTVFRSLDDNLKSQYYEYDDLKGLTPKIISELMAEHRPESMEWFFFEPIQGSL